MERRTEEDVVMRMWKMEVSEHRKIGRPKLGCYTKSYEGESSTEKKHKDGQHRELKLDEPTRNREKDKEEMIVK